MTDRNLIFISHASPEDNEFSGWLAARLISAGYSVWIDLFHDKGRPTWDDIEKAIRTDCIRFVPLVSRRALDKPGFKNEIAAAVAIARELGDEGFVVPIRLDDASYRTEISIELIRLNFIDASSGGWSEALRELLTQFEKDHIPAKSDGSRELFSRWLERNRAANEAVSQTPELLISNWFQIVSLPKQVFIYGPRGLAQNWPKGIASLRLPRVYNNRQILCAFAPFDDVQMALPLGVGARKIEALRVSDFLAASGNANPYPTPSDAHRAMVDLVRQSFGKFVESRGLVRHQLSNRLCWFAPRALTGLQRYPFDIGVLNGARQLVGRHKDVYWHFAISIDVNLHAPRRLTFSGHVLFSADGQSILADNKLATRLRRQATRSKQNAWWRDVMLSYVSFVSENKRSFDLLPNDLGLRISSRPMVFKSPVSFSFDQTEEYSEIESPIDDELLDFEEVDEVGGSDEGEESDNEEKA